MAVPHSRQVTLRADANDGIRELKSNQILRKSVKPQLTAPRHKVVPVLHHGGRPEDPTIDQELAVSSIALRRGMVEAESYDKVDLLPVQYVQKRRDLVDLVCEAGSQCHLAPSTSHVAVGYMDKVASAFIHDQRWQIVPASCLMLAAKWEEKTYEKDYEKLPDVRELCEIILKWHGYPPEHAEQRLEWMAGQLHHLEVEIAQTMDWRMSIVTPLHYLGMYRRCGVLFSNDVVIFRNLTSLADDNREQVFQYLEGYLTAYAEMCLQSPEFYSAPSSLLSAGMVLATRKALNIRPLWNPALTKVLGHQRLAVLEVQEKIWELYRSEYPDRAASSEKREQEALEYARRNGLPETDEDFEAIYGPADDDADFDDGDAGHADFSGGYGAKDGHAGGTHDGEGEDVAFDGSGSRVAHGRDGGSGGLGKQPLQSPVGKGGDPHPMASPMSIASPVGALGLSGVSHGSNPVNVSGLGSSGLGSSGVGHADMAGSSLGMSHVSEASMAAQYAHAMHQAQMQQAGAGYAQGGWPGMAQTVPQHYGMGSYQASYQPVPANVLAAQQYAAGVHSRGHAGHSIYGTGLLASGLTAAALGHSFAQAGAGAAAGRDPELEAAILHASAVGSAAMSHSDTENSGSGRHVRPRMSVERRDSRGSGGHGAEPMDAGTFDDGRGRYR